jgi:hypothetical protein
MDLRDETSEGAAAPSAFPSSSLPYRGDLDAARKAKDVQAIRYVAEPECSRPIDISVQIHTHF